MISMLLCLVFPPRRGVTTANPVRGGYTGTAPKCTTCSYHYSPETPCRSCFNCNCLGHFAKDCRVVPRNVNPVNARNPVARTYYECGSTDHIKSAYPRLNQAQRLGETIRTKLWLLIGVRVMGTNGIRQEVRHSYVEPSDLGFSYEIEIASGQLVEIDKVIKGCKLEIEGHVFDINLIPFGSGSFDVIIGMDWLSDHKAEIICHEKVVRIPLLDGKVLRVLGEKPKEKMRQVMSAKANDKKQKEIVVVKDFLEVFPDDLSGLSPMTSDNVYFIASFIPCNSPILYNYCKELLLNRLDLRITVITEYLVNISKRRAFWSLNEDILKITIMTTNMSYPSRKTWRIRACTHQRPQRKEDQYAVSRKGNTDWNEKEEETAKIFKIETDVFDYETPLCLAFNEFNYLIKIDPDLLTKDIMGFKTYEDYKDDWIYEWNENVPWVYDKPWLDNGIWKEPKSIKHTCKPFHYKIGCSERPTCSWRKDAYCNGGNLPEAYYIGNSLHYQDLEWYEALKDSKLKDEAL
ncbi:putative reverse transcriptase domain-containing protein [Tanacetum coccineum]